MKANEERINANRSHYTEIARVSYGFPKHSRHLTRQRWKSRWDKTVAEYLLAIQPQLFAQQNVISPLKRSLQPGERGFPLVSRGMLLKQARRWKKFGNISFVCRRFDDYKNLLENLRSILWFEFNSGISSNANKSCCEVFTSSCEYTCKERLLAKSWCWFWSRRNSNRSNSGYASGVEIQFLSVQEIFRYSNFSKILFLRNMTSKRHEGITRAGGKYWMWAEKV